MTRVMIAAPDFRKPVLCDEAKTPKEILAENNINTTKATIMIDGMVLNPEQQRQSLADLHATGDCTLSITVKLDNAA